tara:strand:+ start:2391 stop:2600 length:210 start_codon:yes stop_codon:yes gene_type:complete
MIERIGRNETAYVLCEECKQLIGPSTPAVEVSHGFVTGTDFYIDESVIVHTECVQGDTLEKVVDKIEKN